MRGREQGKGQIEGEKRRVQRNGGKGILKEGLRIGVEGRE